MRRVGITESPLTGRVVFVIGVARSGTTWLAQLIGQHPDFVGSNESHLFDRGVNQLFDNFENRVPEERYLASYMDRDDLVGLVRELCDGVFLRMRERNRPDARFVVEKTPFGEHSFRAELRRKLECYPDAWYVHLIRDPRAIVRSWHERWGAGRPASSIAEVWAQSIHDVRSQLGDSPRFREVHYKDLLESPVDAMGELIDWFAARRDPEIDSIIRETAGYAAGVKPARDEETWEIELPAADIRAIEDVAGDQMLEDGYELLRPAVAPWHKLRAKINASGRVAPVASRLAGRARARRAVRTSVRWALPEGPITELCESLARALAEADGAALRSLASPELRLEMRTGAGDCSAKGDQAINALRAAAHALFKASKVSARWVPSVGEPMSSLWFTGMRADARRIDGALAFTVEDGRVAHLTLLCLSPDGLHPSPWDPALKPELGPTS